ncbi:MAG: STAS domain-containing protein [Alphaproteobacteria bacterium]|nr:STAS domain-containing protein [Alphaproteobacteria bacterium]
MPTAQLFEIQNNPQYSLVRFFGYVDADTVEKVKPALQEQIPAGCKQLIIDLEKVEFLDSHGVGMFVSFLKRVHSNNGRLIIATPEGQPASVLQMVGFNGPLVSFFENTQAACDNCLMHNQP